ncbi:hypothetical protein MJT46_009350 [Ovis ammon polii x Ovis aries]|nr:hypothetical protein MJT46_009350 [Ovis ammon polii x Ovis aries]
MKASEKTKENQDEKRPKPVFQESSSLYPNLIDLETELSPPPYADPNPPLLPQKGLSNEFVEKSRNENESQRSIMKDLVHHYKDFQTAQSAIERFEEGLLITICLMSEYVTLDPFPEKYATISMAPKPS